MGFAALETMGYGLVALIRSQGDVGVLEEVLLIRGLLSPVGHATWTGLICAVLWHKREQTGLIIGGASLALLIRQVREARRSIPNTAQHTAHSTKSDFRQ